MNPMNEFTDLLSYDLSCYDQFWYYVILLNPFDRTKAGEAVLRNLNIFHLDSGAQCQFFLPGFANTGRGLSPYNIFSGFGRGGRPVEVPGWGRVRFVGEDFVELYKHLEWQNKQLTGWRYSGECELLLFGIRDGSQLTLHDFASYNLDDIVRNGRNVSEFIRAAINVGKDATDQLQAKRTLDEKYYDMIMPDLSEADEGIYEKGWNILHRQGFREDSYYFLSYSSRDHNLVHQIRGQLEKAGIPCWMAPYDIPSGSNYAWVIEHAIKHAKKFVLLLSPSAAQSVWVGKELKRAISRHQKESPEKLCAAWLYEPFPLQDTPLALPLEDIQIQVDLHGDPQNILQILK